MVNKRVNKTGNLTVSLDKRKKASKRGNISSLAHNSTKRHIVWNDALTPSFLESATKSILLNNQELGVPVIYAKNGIIYKELRSVKITLGKITGLERLIKEDSYSIE